MIRLYTDPRMIAHRPPPGHPERPERLRDVIRHLERTGLSKSCEAGAVRPATDAELLRVHTPAHLAEIASWRDSPTAQIEADTWMSTGSELAARLAAGAVIDAVGSVVTGQSKRAFCAVRPPGHHTRPGGAMGFCLYASVAAAAADALERHGLNRVLVVDWDVHHGNGTQEIFYDDPRVAFLSLHRSPFYPGTGDADETGTGRGLGWTKNVPLPLGVPRADYLAVFASALDELADRARPDLILISAGFDAHAEDPVGSLGLEVEDFVAMTERVGQVADTHCGGRVVSVLEGGYNIPILCGCVEAHLKALGGGG